VRISMARPTADYFTTGQIVSFYVH
jgi:hypothetical protein